MMYKGETSPKIDLLTKSDTTERNGTEIKIIIKNEYDLLKFLDETYNQLHYFQNVVLDLDDLKSLYSSYNSYSSISRNINSTLQNLEKDYRLIEGVNFIARTNTSFQELHLCIGNVAYPIDWNNLKTTLRINLPLALKFDIGELPVIQTREDIRYTDKSINLIQEKIKLLKEELTELKKKEALKDFEDLEDFRNNTSKLKDQTLTLTADNFILRFGVSSYIDSSKIPATQIKNFPIVFKSNKDVLNFYNKLESTYYRNPRGYNFVDNIHDFVGNNVSVVKTFNSIGSLLTTNKIIHGYNEDTPSTYRTVNEFFDKINVIKEKVRIGSLLLFKLGDNWSLQTKKNRYIQEVLYKNIRPEDMYFVHVNNRFKLPISIYKMLLNHFNSILSKEESKIIIQYLFGLLYKDFQKLFVDYNTIKVDEVWWKERQAENRTEVDYDRSLMSIETYITYEWERKDYRPNLEEYINNHNIRILITKEQQKQLCTNSREYHSSSLEKFIQDINTLNRTEFIKNKVVLHSTAQRNYDKIIKYRNENSNIFTLEEFFKNKKMQTRILSKLITVLKIKNIVDNHTVFTIGTNFQKMKSFINIMNEDFVADYEYVSKYLSEYRNVFQLSINSLEDLLKDIEDVNLHVDLYDKELITKFDNIMEFMIESKFNLLSYDIADLTKFITTYKPSKVKYRLNTIFNKSDIDNVYIEKVAKELKLINDIATPEEIASKINNTISINNFGYDGEVNNRILLVLLCKKRDFTQKYIPLTPQELSLDLTPDPVEDTVAEVVVQEEIDVEEEIEFV